MTSISMCRTVKILKSNPYGYLAGFKNVSTSQGFVGVSDGGCRHRGRGRHYAGEQAEGEAGGLQEGPR